MSAEHKTLVQWREWNAQSFDEAKRNDKPILLDIGAVWCHWCHVMDSGIPGDPVHTGTYSNPEIAELIHERFIPIKVDNDRNPDINTRYNMGGWPTTAFLTPDGQPLYGETYVAPDRMKGLLNYVADYYRDNKDEIHARISEHVEEPCPEKIDVALSPEIAKSVVGAIKANFDFAYGGFGTQPKFPHSDALEFAIAQYSSSRDEELRLIVEKTLDAMAGGGTYDQYAGGFFRYSTMRDWSIPHYEKMLEDNAKLSRICLLASRVFDEPRFAEVAKDVNRWLFDVMFNAQTQTFAGSQDADKEDAYYGLNLDDRAKMPTPFIDWTIYSDWNALAVSSMVERYRCFEEPEILMKAEECFRFVTESIAPKHYYADGRSHGQENLLTDSVALANASIDLFEATGKDEYLDHAKSFAETILTTLRDAETGVFWDISPAAGALGALSRPKAEINGNSDAARVTIRLSAFTGDAKYRAAAHVALGQFAGEYKKLSFFAANYASAVAQALAPELHVVIVGLLDEPDDMSYMFRRVCWKILPRTAAIEMRDSSNAGEYPPNPNGRAIAYVCVGTNCQIASTTEGLAEILRAATKA